MAHLITTFARLSTGHTVTVEAIETGRGWHARPALGQRLEWDTLYPASGADFNVAVAAIVALCERLQGNADSELSAVAA